MFYRTMLTEFGRQWEAMPWVTGCRWNFIVSILFNVKLTYVELYWLRLLVSSGHQLEPSSPPPPPPPTHTPAYSGDRRHARIKFDDEVLSGRVRFSMISFYTVDREIFARKNIHLLNVCIVIALALQKCRFIVWRSYDSRCWKKKLVFNFRRHRLPTKICNENFPCPVHSH